jgi:type I restriction enzyme M protein
MAPQGFDDKVAFVWKVADKLRGTFKQHEYGSVMLPLLVLRRMDAVLAPTKAAVLAKANGMSQIGPGQDALLKKAAGRRFYNISPLTFATLLHDDKHLADNLAAYISCCPRRRRRSSTPTRSSARSSGWTARASCMPCSRTSRTSTCARPA